MPADLVRANPTLQHVRRAIVSVMALGAALSLAGCGASLGGDPQSGLTADQPGVLGPANAASSTTEQTQVDRSKSTTVATSNPVVKVATLEKQPLAGKPVAAAKSGSSSVEKAAETLTAVATPGSTAYKIGPQDILEVSVFKAPELSKSVQVADNGAINLPLLNEVQASGKTAQEVERDLASKLGAKYLQKPQVTVFVKEYNSQRVTLEGAVKKPGVYPVRGRVTLLQYVAMAEGLTDISDQTLVIFRTTEGKRSGGKYDLSDIRSGVTPDPVVQSGDVIIAPTSAMKETFGMILKALPLAALAPLL